MGTEFYVGVNMQDGMYYVYKSVNVCWSDVVSGPHKTKYLANVRKRYREVMQEVKCLSTK